MDSPQPPTTQSPQLSSNVQYAVTSLAWDNGILTLAADRIMIQDFNNAPVFQASIEELSAVKADRNGAFLTIETKDGRQQVVCFTKVEAFIKAGFVRTVQADTAQQLTMSSEVIADFKKWCDYFEARGLLQPLYNKKLVTTLSAIAVVAVLVVVYLMAK